MITPEDRFEIMQIMAECSTRLSFSLIEITYIIGRARTRPIDPWSTEKIASKLGITSAQLILFEAIMVENAQLQDLTCLTRLAARREEILDELMADRVNQIAQVEKLADNWIDPGTLPLPIGIVSPHKPNGIKIPPGIS